MSAPPSMPEPPPDPMLDPAALRAEFPALIQSVRGKRLVYLDNAATTQKPRSVIQALRDYYERDNANVHRGVHELAHRATAAFEGARERVALFLNASSSSEVVFTRGTTEAINLISYSWGDMTLRSGDEILLTEMEHHSNLVPWQRLARRTGARLRFWPIDPLTGELRLEEVERCFTPATRVFAFTHTSNVLGTVNPAEWLCQEAQRRGVVTVVDAAQSAGHMHLDVRKLGCDFLAFSGHKACGPTGIGVLYGRRELLDSMQPWQGGGEMIETVGWSDSTYAPPPQRFEAGTPPISGAIGLHAALDFLDKVGRSQIHAHIQKLTRYGVEQLGQVPGIRILGNPSHRGGVISFVMDGVHAHDLVTFADEFGIALRGGHHCAQPLLQRLGVDSAVRASAYFYNTMAELDRLTELVKNARDLFG